MHCKDCVYWVLDDQATRDATKNGTITRVGKCHFNPPTVAVVILPTDKGLAVNQQSMRPHTEAMAYCSQFADRANNR